MSSRKTTLSLLESPTLITEKLKSKTGETTTRKWVKGGFLGKGGFAKVYEFTNTETRQTYASKVIPKESLLKKRAKQKLISEIKIHKSVKHEYIVGFEHYFEDPECVYILLELCPNQSMNELLKRRKRLHEIEVRYYTNQIISSLEYLHKNRVIHRDLKLGNLFINENMELKLGDFGLAAKLDFDGERKRTIWGTPNYIAPEVLEGRNGHSFEVDIWSLGVIIYTLIIGKPPFETTDVKSTYDKIRKNSYYFPEHVNISKEAKELIQLILHNDPSKRPSLEDIKNHNFLVLPTPKTLHPSMLACPPSKTFINKYTITSNTNYQSWKNLMTNKENLVLKIPQTAKDPQRDGIDIDIKLSTGSRSSSRTNKLEDAKLQEEALLSATVPIHAKKWIDYTSKYGLGYVLSDGSIGVFFNDATKIVWDKFRKEFEYYEKNKNSEDSPIKHSLTDFPSEYEKKVTLLHHFKSYLDQNIKTEDIEHTRPTGNLIYIK
jgi:polo-like kinase 1